MRLLPVVAAVTAAFLVVACSTPVPPRGVTVVTDFDARRYMGTWYEIARFDHRFESGLEKVTTTYSLRDDGGLTSSTKATTRTGACGRKQKGKPGLRAPPAAPR
ncbi:outer membrane lipoprotein Blc [Citrobacter koseri]|uniref:Outer membrane lipoprotein Blc n=1 Tax=Citrobacter koseri TaxID=545 RepID=A0A3S4M7F2_CITKO|nr:outer membrane lipoprotein Blc [Citrobacter koseri]